VTLSVLAVVVLAAAALERRRNRRRRVRPIAHDTHGSSALPTKGEPNAAQAAAQPSFEEIAHKLPQILFMADDAGVVRYANPAWSAHTGQDVEVAPHLHDAVHPDDRAMLQQAWQRARHSHVPLSLPLRLRDAQNRYRRFQVQATPVRAGDGAWRWYGIFSDVEEPSRAHEQLAETDRRSDIFLATLAHELRNPLAPIRNAAQVLMTPGRDRTQQTWAVQVIDRQVTNLGLLLDDLLEASRITLGTLTLNKEAIVMRGVVDAAVELARPALDRQRHDFSVSGDALDQSLVADPLRLTQVLGILLDNAARYTSPGGRINLDVSRLGDQVKLRVRDNGIGLAAADLERVFDMFTQVRAAAPLASAADRSQSEGGLGIGLALVKGLVGLHGGSVSVSSPGLGQGCAFQVLLPLGATPQPAQVPQKGTRRNLASAGTLRVLVVDDNHDGADTLAALLKYAGHCVDVAYDGQQALHLAQSVHPDVALIDLGMPRIDGCEVARRLRREPWSEGLYLIATTGWGQAEDKQRTQASGFDRHLVKPIDPLHIVQILADRGRMPTHGNSR